LVDVLAEVANIICCLDRPLEVLLSEGHAGGFSVGVVVGVTDVIEVRQLVNHSLHLLRVVWVVEGEVAYVNLLCCVGGVHKGVSRASANSPLSRRHPSLAYIARAVHHSSHRVELLHRPCNKLPVGRLGAEPRVDSRAARRLGAGLRGEDLVAGVLMPPQELCLLRTRATVVRHSSSCLSQNACGLLLAFLLSCLEPLFVFLRAHDIDRGVGPHDVSVFQVLRRISAWFPHPNVVQAISF